ncbi:MAG TPA: ABC transporter permease subunit [Bacteroidota bacterium]|nr:ABC transporter permease subunit [Bacteroidota bacterium]
MIRLIYYELVKTFLKKRTYIGFLLVGVIVPLIEVAMKLEGGRFLQHSLRSLQQDFLFVGNLFNGWFVAHNMMNSLWIHIPLLISFVAGDQLAGEATAGTYRLILVRPVSRTRIFLSKYATTVIYTLVFVSFMALLSVGLSLALLGGGDLIVILRGILVIPESDVLWRFLVGYLLAAWAMITIASLAFFFSSFVENAIGPIISTMGVNMIFLLITVIPLDFFQDLKPYVFTNYMNVWQKAFEDPVPWDSIGSSVAVLGAYSLVFVVAAWLIFRRKDILT